MQNLGRYYAQLLDAKNHLQIIGEFSFGYFKAAIAYVLRITLNPRALVSLRVAFTTIAKPLVQIITQFHFSH